MRRDLYHRNMAHAQSPSPPWEREGVKAARLFEEKYPHLRQPRESPKRKASISHPSKEAGLREPSLPKMLYGLPARKPLLRRAAENQRDGPAHARCAASSASG